MPLPSAIIFINSEAMDGYILTTYNNKDGYISKLVDGYAKTTLLAQLFINEFMDDAEYDSRIQSIPNYPDIVHLQGLRILVSRKNYRDYTNRQTADVVLFFNQGQVTIEMNKFGPPGLSLPIYRLNIYTLLREVGSKNVVILPPNIGKPPKALGGIVAEQLCDPSGVYAANPDNEYNNPDFINRK